MFPALTVLGLIVVPIALLMYLYRRPLPRVNGTLKVSGLTAPIKIMCEVTLEYSEKIEKPRGGWGPPLRLMNALHFCHKK